MRWAAWWTDKVSPLTDLIERKYVNSPATNRAPVRVVASHQFDFLADGFPNMKLLSAFSLVLLLAVTGCGESKIHVSGSVLYNDKPLPNVNVVMIRTDGKVASAVTDSSGNFASVTTDAPGDGAIAGDYKVGITPVSTVPDAQTSADAYAIPTISPVPQSYMSADSSGLKVVVEMGMAPVKLELKD